MPGEVALVCLHNLSLGPPELLIPGSKEGKGFGQGWSHLSREVYSQLSV